MHTIFCTDRSGSLCYAINCLIQYKTRLYLFQKFPCTLRHFTESSLNKLPYDLLSPSCYHLFIPSLITDPREYMKNLLGPYWVRMVHQCQYDFHPGGTGIKQCLPSWSVISSEPPSHGHPSSERYFCAVQQCKDSSLLATCTKQKRTKRYCQYYQITNPRNLFFSEVTVKPRDAGSWHVNPLDIHCEVDFSLTSSQKLIL